MRWYSASEPSQYTRRSGFVSFVASSTQFSSGVAILISLPAQNFVATSSEVRRTARNTLGRGPIASVTRFRWTRPCQQDHAKAGTSGQAGRLSVSTRSQFMLPLAAQASSVPVMRRSLVLSTAEGSGLHLPVPYLITSLLHRFAPAVNSSPLSSHAESDRLRVILVAPRNPLNIGAAARAMSNFGFFHLRVVNPFELAFRQARSA